MTTGEISEEMHLKPENQGKYFGGNKLVCLTPKNISVKFKVSL